MIKENKLEEAIKLFKLNVEEYPESANVYDSLGEAYMVNKEYALAIKNYQKSFELNPNNTNAKSMVNQINEKLKSKNK